MGTQKVTFARDIVWAGFVAGLAIALGVPAVVLPYAGSWTPWVTAAVVILALLTGGTCVLVSAFFGSVMPKEVERSDEPGKGPGKGGQDETGKA